MIKTNAMRILDKNKINYKIYSYDSSKAISGIEVAHSLKQNPDMVFKTLVTTAKSRVHYVFLIPVIKELDLKKAAISVNEKSIEMLKQKDLFNLTGYVHGGCSMLKQKDLFNLTGYVHGGCSPIGMKKYFDTVIDISAQNNQTIIFSAGKIGYQIETTLKELSKVIEYKLAQLTL